MLYLMASKLPLDYPHNNTQPEQMKTSLLLLVPFILLASCKKDTTVVPDNTQTTSNSKPASSNTTSNTTTSSSSSIQPQKPSTPTTPTTPTTPAYVDTLANLSGFKVKLAMDSTNYDETMFLFRKTATPAFNGSEDAEYLQGYGQVSLASIASDGTDLAINSLPYTPNMSMKLDFNTKGDGAYLLKMSFERTIPSNMQVWIRDNYAKDSLNMRTGNYKFNVVRSDANSYGKGRFQIVLKTVH